MKTYNFDEILTQQDSAVQAAVEDRFQDLLRGFPLSSLRSDSGRSQSEVAEALHISQAAVSKMESRSDMLMSTLHRYVKALGGSVRIGVSIDDRAYVIESSNARGTAFAVQRETRGSPAQLYGSRASETTAGKVAHMKEYWSHKRAALHDVTIGSVVVAAVANDHECLLDAVA